MSHHLSERTFVIDEHRHIGYAASRPTRAAADIVAEMDRLGVDHAVIVAGAAKPLTREEELAAETDTYAIVEEYLQTGESNACIERLQRETVDQSLVFEALKTGAGRLFGGYILNPWLLDTEFDSARRAVREFGLRYIKLHPWGNAFAADDRNVMEPVVELGSELDVPLWFHTGYGPGTEPERVGALADAFPRVRLIMGHACVCGRPDAVADIVRSHENLWMDLADAGDDAMRTVINGAPEDRIMLASDDPWGFPLDRFCLAAQIERVLRVARGQTRLKRKILGGNAAQLLKIGA